MVLTALTTFERASLAEPEIPTAEILTKNANAIKDAKPLFEVSFYKSYSSG